MDGLASSSLLNPSFSRAKLYLPTKLLSSPYSADSTLLGFSLFAFSGLSAAPSSPDHRFPVSCSHRPISARHVGFPSDNDQVLQIPFAGLDNFRFTNEQQSMVSQTSKSLATPMDDDANRNLDLDFRPEDEVGGTTKLKSSRVRTNKEHPKPKFGCPSFQQQQSSSDVRNDARSEIGVDIVEGISPSWSLGKCNSILMELERSSNVKAMKFFIWMRSNSKLRGNAIAYNLALRVLGRNGQWEDAEDFIHEMKFKSDCKLDHRSFNAIIFVCSKRGLVDVGTRWFHFMLEYGVEPNIATFGMLMSLYQKDWNVKEAEFAFTVMRKLRVKCQSAYSSMITIYTRLGMYAKAEEVILLLNDDDVTLNCENWLVTINAYSQQGKLGEAELVLESMKSAGFPPNIVAYNTLITGHGKVSNMDAAENLFCSLKIVGLEPDETTLRSMVEGWARVGNYEKVKWYYEKLRRAGLTPNSSNLYSLLHLQAKHGDEVGAVETLNEMVRIGCQPSSVLSTLLRAYEKIGRCRNLPLVVRGSMYEYVLNNQTACSILVMAYVKNSSVDDAIAVLSEKQWNDPYFEDNMYHLLICSCKESGHLENAVKIFSHMVKCGNEPDLHMMSTMIDIYSKINQFDEAQLLYQKMKSSSEVALDLVAYSVVVRMYVKAGLLDDACSVLETMEQQENSIVPDVYLLMDMLRIYQQLERLDKLSDLYYRILKSRHIVWDQEMYRCVINCCAQALPVDELTKLFDEMIQKGFSPNTVTCNVMLDVYGKARLFRKARKVLLLAKNRGIADVISYNTLIAAYGRSKRIKKMKSTVKMMQFNGFSVSLEAYNSMLDSYGKKRQMEKFREVLERMQDQNCQFDSYTYNILINIYGNQGWIEEVEGVLKELKGRGLKPDLCSYNTLIKAYGIAGMVDDALNVLKEMVKNGIKPDKATYQNLISAMERNDEYLEAVKWSLWVKQMGVK